MVSVFSFIFALVKLKTFSFANTIDGVNIEIKNTIIIVKTLTFYGDFFRIIVPFYGDFLKIDKIKRGNPPFNLYFLSLLTFYL